MSLLVILLLVVFLVSALYPKHIHHALCLALLSMVLLYTLVYFIEWHQIDLVTIFYYASVGVFVGCVWFFTGSFLLAENPHEHIKKSLLGVRHTALMASPEIAYQIGLTGCKELIWRVFLVGALTQFLPVWLCIIIAASLFWLLHEESWPPNNQSIELFQFSLALTMMYAYTGSLMLVWCAHMVRVILTMSANSSGSPSALVSKQNP